MNKIKRLIRRAQNNPLSKWNTIRNFVSKSNRRISRFNKEKVCTIKNFIGDKVKNMNDVKIKKEELNKVNKTVKVQKTEEKIIKKENKVEENKSFSSFFKNIFKTNKKSKILKLDTAMPKEVTVEYAPKSYVSESFRTLRTNIQFMNANKDVKAILVTSTMPGEGKSYVVANLAATFAQANKKVIIVDADMRKGRTHEIFKVSKLPGLSNYLSGVMNAEDKRIVLKSFIRETTIENLYVMPMGNTPPNPSELLATEKMSNLVKELKEIFDVVIFDGTPSKIVTDAVILSRQVDTTLIVTGYNKAKMDDLKKIQKDIENVGGNIAGVVINSVPMNTRKYASSYYYENLDGNRKKVKRMYSL